jgi:hypothetical protein
MRFHRRAPLPHSREGDKFMPVATIAAFWAVSFMFVITPGAD